MLRIRPTLALLAAAIAASSCRVATDSDLTAAGVWSSGQLAGLTNAYAPVFDLTESPSGRISGTVTVIQHSSSSRPQVDVTGEHRGSTVALSWTLDECHCVFVGTLSADSIYGTLTSYQGTLPQTLTPGIDAAVKAVQGG